VCCTRTHRRPPTSCAHRLRKPDRTCEPLTLSVASRPRGERAPTRFSRGALCAPSEDDVPRAPRRQTRWTRRRFRATSNRTNQSAFHRIDPDLAIRADSAALVVHAHGLAPHPVARREPWPPRQRQAGRFELSRLRRESPLGSSSRRRERCVSPTSATDLRSEHPTDCPIPERAASSLAALRMRRPAFGQWPRADPRVEPRLTASLQLRHHHNRSGERVRGWGPKRPRDGTLRGPGGASIEVAPPRCVSRPRRFRPRAELVTWPLTPSVAAPPRFFGLSAESAGRSRQTRLHRLLVKDDGFFGIRTPSLDECPLPHRTACATLRDRCEPATVLAALPPRAGFGRPFTTRARGRMARPNALHTGFPAWRPTWTRRLSSTSATRTIHEHDRSTARSPARACRRVSPSSRWTGR
jgi:hypothetical protein